MASEPLTPPLVVIAGPTASGKTSLAIAIAKQFNGEIICADSRTIYKGMDIGTAKPTPEEQRAVAHWGLDLVEPGDEFNVAEKSPKRLMRDTHTGMLGGVCAGIAEYFRIDAVIVRIIAIILMLVSFGAVCFVYVVLWLIVPKATTAADRLQMAGAPVTLDGIKEVAARTPDSDGRMKPLLVLLRVLLVLLFAGMAVGMLVVIVMATVFGVPVISEMTPHFRATGWGIGALTAGVLSGALFVVLMGLLIYMVVVWRTSKRIGVMAGTITLVGLGTMVLAFGLAAQGATAFRAEEASKRRVESVSAASELADVKQLRVTSPDVVVNYEAGSTRPWMELKYTEGYRPDVSIAKNGTSAELVVKRPTNPCLHQTVCLQGEPTITVYGPVVDAIAVSGAQTEYTPDVTAMNYHAPSQDKLTVTLGRQANISISGAVKLLEAKLDRNAGVTLFDGTVDAASITAASGAKISTENVASMNITTPAMCEDSRKVAITVQEVNTLTINGKSVHFGDELHCAEVNKRHDSQWYNGS